MANIWNKDAKMMEMLVQHYNLELRASNLYYNCATVAKAMGYDYVSIFFVNLGKDKQTSHMLRILDFFIKLDTELPVLPMSVPERIQNASIQEVVKQAMQMEMAIRKHVTDVCDYAMKINDFEVFQRMQWFVKDAIKDLHDIDDLATYANAPGATLLSIETAINRKNNHKEMPLYDSESDLD